MSLQALQNSSVAFTLAGMFLAGASACGGGSGDGGGGADAGVASDAGERTDAGPQADADVAPACATVADFGDLGVIDGEVISADGYLSIDSTLEAGPPPDLFVVELFGGLEPFVDGITTGTFEITGAQTEYQTCGVCATVYADFGESGSSMIYLAQSGTVTVTSIAGNFTGSFVPAGDTASYVGFSIDEAIGEYVKQDACVVTGGGASWDKAIPAME